MADLNCILRAAQAGDPKAAGELAALLYDELHEIAPIEDREIAAPLADEDLLALDEAVGRLAELDPTKARIVELRFFAGLSMAELARTLGASESTIQREWRMARARLRTQLDDSRAP